MEQHPREAKVGPGRAVWRDVAARRHARLAQNGASMRLRVGAAEVAVDVMAGETCARASYPFAAGPVFLLHPRTASLRLAVLPLTSHPVVETGILAVDARFLLRSSEPEASVAALSARAGAVAAALTEHFPDALVIGEPGSVRLELPQVVVHPRALDAAIDVVAAMAGADVCGLPALRALPGAQEIGPGIVEVKVGGTPVCFSPQRTSRGAGTKAWVDVVAAPVFHVSLPGPTPAVLPAAAVAKLAGAGAGFLVGTGTRIVLVWPGVVRDAARLLAGAEMLAEMAR